MSTNNQIKRVIPLVWVTDVPQAIEYYMEKMGFDLAFECGDDDTITFAIVERDGFEFHLQICICDDGRHAGNTFFEVRVEDVEGLFEEFKASGVEMVRDLKQQEWGQSDFKIADPDGNWILFASDFDDDEE